MKEEVKNSDRVAVINLSKYVQPEIKLFTGKKWVLNGDNNSFYKYVKDCYDDSQTNSAIIDAYCNYIYGEGLVDANNESTTIEQFVSQNDIKLMIQDFKTYGSFSFQVIWNLEHTKPVKLKYINVTKLGLNFDYDSETITGYWYSFDWTQQTRYKPKFYSMFNGTYKNENVELLIISRPTSNPFFANPDYSSGLPYAKLEAELANSSINHVMNGFQGGIVVNFNGGVPETEELIQEYRTKIIGELTGTQNTNKVIVSFNENKDQAITVERIPVDELNQQYVDFNDRAEQKLIVAHSAPPILFSGSKDGGGLGNNAEELVQATKSLYKKKIYPYRSVVLNGLNEAFKYIDSAIKLEFKDFDDLNIK